MRELISHEFYQPDIEIKSRLRSSSEPTMMTWGSVLVIACVLWMPRFPCTAGEVERVKRELKFPKGGSFVAAVALASFLPKGPTDGLAHVLEFDLGFPFPEKFVFSKTMALKKTQKRSNKTIMNESWYQPYRKTPKSTRRKRNSDEKDKLNLLHKIEDAITRIGFNGFACVSRFQCELKNISPENSLLEELLFALFKTSFEPREADCEAYNKICPVSLLHIIMHSEQISVPQTI